MREPANLSDQDRTILELIYGLAISRGKWPTFRVVDIQLDRLLGVADSQTLLLAVPAMYLRRPWQPSGFGDGDEVRLTLRGVAACERGPQDLELLVRLLRWTAEVEQNRPIDEASDLTFSSAEFAESLGWPLESENTSSDLPSSPAPEDGDIDSIADGAPAADPSPEIARSRSAIERLRMLAHEVRFWRGAGHRPDTMWIWQFTVEPRNARAYRHLSSVGELLDAIEPLHDAERLIETTQSGITADDRESELSEAAADSVAPAIEPMLGLLREEIAVACSHQVAAGLFDEAIFAAYRYVESELQRRTGLSDIGNALIEHAFRSSSNPIRVSNRSADTERLIQVFGGALGLFKGDRSHKDRPALPCRSLRECMHQLGHASSLLDLLDRDVQTAPYMRAYDHNEHALVLRVDRLTPQIRVLLGERRCPVTSRSEGTITVDVSDVPAGEHELVLIDGTKQSPGQAVWLSREPGRKTWYRVEEINVPLYSDAACTNLMSTPGVRLAILESGLAREQILPTAHSYRVGDYVSWDWDKSKSLGPAWVRDAEGAAATQLFIGSALFEGEPEAPAHLQRTMRIALQPGRLRLRVGDKAPLVPTAYITDGSATWTTPVENPKVSSDAASVVFYKDGVVHAKSPGTTALRLEAEGLFAEAIAEVAAHPSGTVTDWITGMPPIRGLAWTNKGLVVSSGGSLLYRVGTDGKFRGIAGLPSHRSQPWRADTIAANSTGDIAVRSSAHREILILRANDGYASSRSLALPYENLVVSAIAWHGDDLLLASNDGSVWSTTPNGEPAVLGQVESYPTGIAAYDDTVLVLTGGKESRLWKLRNNESAEIYNMLDWQGTRRFTALTLSESLIYLAAFYDGHLLCLDGERLTSTAEGLTNPSSIAAAPDGTIYIGELGRGSVRRMMP